MTLKTRHWMMFLPILAVGFWFARAVIQAGIDGRTVRHTHVTSHVHTTPFSARLSAVLRGKESAKDYACPLEATPIESEFVYWPH
jgi:hypothetical protein